MTRIPTRQPLRAAAVAATVCALIGAGATSAFADELAVEPLTRQTAAEPAATDDPLAPFRAEPGRAAPVERELVRPVAGTTAAATGSISGKVSYTDITETTLKPLTTGLVQVLEWDAAAEDYTNVAEATTTSNGTYKVAGLPAGTYTVAFFDRTSGTKLLPEFWKDAPLSEWSTDVVVGDGQAITGVDERLEPLLTGYIAGSDRYATSVAISKSGFPADVPCVYIASGANFPDALSAGPAAAECGGPLLLVPPTSLPTAIVAELKRLSPEKIVIAGGTGAVSSAVESKLKSLAPAVKRISGKDRYETSRKIIAYAFDQVPAMWVATGRNFPDALAASAAGAADGLPVLIIDGISSRYELSTSEAILQAGAKQVAIAGGTGAVAEHQARAIDNVYGVSVTRFAGADRYQTALMINKAVWNPEQWWSVYAFLVNGTKFPDALSGAPLAGAYGAPMHVVPPTCTPAGVAKHITDVHAYEAYLLGYFSQLSFNGKPFKIC